MSKKHSIEAESIQLRLSREKKGLAKSNSRAMSYRNRQSSSSNEMFNVTCSTTVSLPWISTPVQVHEVYTLVMGAVVVLNRVTDNIQTLADEIWSVCGRNPE